MTRNCLELYSAGTRKMFCQELVKLNAVNLVSDCIGFI